MREFIGRIVDGVTLFLSAQAGRLVRLMVARHVVTAYESAYAEATALEAAGQGRLAELLRAELDEALASRSATEGGPASLNGADTLGPFSLCGPAPSGPSQPAAAAASEPAMGQGEGAPPRRPRGRPHKAKFMDEEPNTLTPNGE